MLGIGLISDVTVKVGKWASLPLLLLVACGAYFASQCPATSFFRVYVWSRL